MIDEAVEEIVEKEMAKDMLATEEARRSRAITASDFIKRAEEVQVEARQALDAMYAEVESMYRELNQAEKIATAKQRDVAVARANAKLRAHYDKMEPLRQRMQNASRVAFDEAVLAPKRTLDAEVQSPMARMSNRTYPQLKEEAAAIAPSHGEIVRDVDEWIGRLVERPDYRAATEGTKITVEFPSFGSGSNLGDHSTMGQMPGKYHRSKIRIFKDATANPEELRRTVSHEFGHAINDMIANAELDNVVTGAGQVPLEGWGHLPRSIAELWQRRIAGEELQKFGGWRAYKDKFIKPYMGRYYTPSDWSVMGIEGIGRSGNFRAGHEMMSVAIEFFYTEPLRFAREDPEMFELVLKVLKGVA